MLTDALKAERRRSSLRGMLTLLVVFLLSVVALRFTSPDVDAAETHALDTVTGKPRVASLVK